MPSNPKTNTVKQCFNMYQRWIKIKQPEMPLVSGYIEDCLNGYPKGTDLSLSLLLTRIRGIERYVENNPDLQNDDQFDFAEARIIIQNARKKKIAQKKIGNNSDLD